MVWDNRDDFFKIAEDEALDKRIENHGSLKSLRGNVEGCASVERDDQLFFIVKVPCRVIWFLIFSLIWIYFVFVGLENLQQEFTDRGDSLRSVEELVKM